jgi:hypothetical protein
VAIIALFALTRRTQGWGTMPRRDIGNIVASSDD